MKYLLYPDVTYRPSVAELLDRSYQLQQQHIKLTDVQGVKPMVGEHALVNALTFLYLDCALRAPQWLTPSEQLYVDRKLTLLQEVLTKPSQALPEHDHFGRSYTLSGTAVVGWVEQDDLSFLRLALHKQLRKPEFVERYGEQIDQAVSQFLDETLAFRTTEGRAPLLEALQLLSIHKAVFGTLAGWLVTELFDALIALKVWPVGDHNQPERETALVALANLAELTDCEPALLEKIAWVIQKLHYALRCAAIRHHGEQIESFYPPKVQSGAAFLARLGMVEPDPVGNIHLKRKMQTLFKLWTQVPLSPEEQSWVTDEVGSFAAFLDAMVEHFDPEDWPKAMLFMLRDDPKVLATLGVSGDGQPLQGTWLHLRTGELYEILDTTNVGCEREDFPWTVSYRSLLGLKYSRPVSLFTAKAIPFLSPERPS